MAKGRDRRRAGGRRDHDDAAAGGSWRVTKWPIGEPGSGRRRAAGPVRPPVRWRRRAGRGPRHVAVVLRDGRAVRRARRPVRLLLDRVAVLPATRTNLVNILQNVARRSGSSRAPRRLLLIAGQFDLSVGLGGGVHRDGHGASLAGAGTGGASTAAVRDGPARASSPSWSRSCGAPVIGVDQRVLRHGLPHQRADHHAGHARRSSAA